MTERVELPMSKQLTKDRFNYGALQLDVKGKLLALAGQIRNGTKAHVAAILKVGGLIHEAHELLFKAGHEADFGDWAMQELGLSRRTAYNYMGAYARFSDNPEQLPFFTAEAIYMLSSDSVPSEVVAKAIELADSGVKITKDMASELKRGAEPLDEPEKEASRKEWSPPEGVKKYKDKFEVYGEAKPEPPFYMAIDYLGKLIRLVDDIQEQKPNKQIKGQLITLLEHANVKIKEWQKS